MSRAQESFVMGCRKIAMRHAKQVGQGEDPELLEAREGMIEPTRTDAPFWEVVFSPEPEFIYDLEPQEFIPLRKKSFVKFLARSPDGATFWAWREMDSGMIYL